MSLTKHFPQLHIFDSESHDKLRDECMDCVLSPSDLSKPMEYTAAEETEKPLVSRCWWLVDAGGKLEKIVQFKSEPRFPISTKLMRS